MLFTADALHTQTREQYERWHKRDCARCGWHGSFAARWPDGDVCRTCHDRALQQRGRCPGCGTDRILPGLRPDDGVTICPDCAGFSMSYACSRCGHNGKLHGGRRCTRCSPPCCGLRDYGGKWGAIRAALLGGWLSVLITDQETAAELVRDR